LDWPKQLQEATISDNASNAASPRLSEFIIFPSYFYADKTMLFCPRRKVPHVTEEIYDKLISI
jgi:hypothetical protein